MDNRNKFLFVVIEVKQGYVLLYFFSSRLQGKAVDEKVKGSVLVSRDPVLYPDSYFKRKIIQNIAASHQVLIC